MKTNKKICVSASSRLYYNRCISTRFTWNNTFWRQTKFIIQEKNRVSLSINTTTIATTTTSGRHRIPGRLRVLVSICRRERRGNSANAIRSWPSRGVKDRWRIVKGFMYNKTRTGTTDGGRGNDVDGRENRENIIFQSLSPSLSPKKLPVSSDTNFFTPLYSCINVRV